MKFRSSQDGYITRAALLQAAQQHRARTSAISGRRAGQQLAEADVHERDRIGLAGGRRCRSRSRSRRTRRTSSPTTRASGRFAFSPGYFSGRDRRPLARPPTPAAGGNGVYSYGARARSRPTVERDELLGRRRLRARRAAGHAARRRSPRSRRPTGRDGAASTTTPTATFDEAMTASTINAATITLTNDPGAAVPATVDYDAAHADGHAHADGAARARTTYTVDGHGRRRRRHGRGRATGSPPTQLDVQHARRAARARCSSPPKARSATRSPTRPSRSA